MHGKRQRGGMSDIPIVILGGVGSGVMVAQAIRDGAARGGAARVLGFLNDAAAPGEAIAGISVLGPLEGWRDCDGTARFIAAIHKPKQMVARAARIRGLAIPDARLITVCHPTAVVAADAEIGPGCYIGPHAVIMNGARIGAHCSLRAGCYVSHDVRLGDFAFVGPNASVSGRAVIGEGAHVGPNAAVREEVTMGDHALAGIGAVVIADVAARAIVAGNPARPIGEIAPGG